MNKVKIFTDSTCDLSKQMLDEYDITMVPLYVTFNDSSYKDTVDMNTADLYEKVNELGVLPKTSAPTPADFIQAFKPYIEDGCDIVYIGLSSKLSSTIQNASLAAQEFPAGRIHIIDSLNLSTGIGILVMKAYDLVQEGLDAAGVTKLISQMVPKVRTAFTIDTFEYLYKGGRCSAMQGLIGGMLKIKPITKLIDGNILLYDKQRGRKKALSVLLQEVENDRETVDNSRIFITHSFAEEAAVYLKEELSNTQGFKNVLV
ncbi:MAG: fatty acid-binding protein DegV, partial [Clostridia bacterium]|nr:fatty acid-binding protein DegV [Clostridia bacterium]